MKKTISELFVPKPRLLKYLILRELVRNPYSTQAYLAQNVGLCVAMVNSYMKNMVDKGLIIYERKNRKVISYPPTDAGLQFVAEVRKELEQELPALCREYNIDPKNICKAEVAYAQPRAATAAAIV
jgi:predicted transcriptional regulator